MRTILIAHRDADFAEQLATEVRAWLPRNRVPWPVALDGTLHPV